MDQYKCYPHRQPTSSKSTPSTPSTSAADVQNANEFIMNVISFDIYPDMCPPMETDEKSSPKAGFWQYLALKWIIIQIELYFHHTWMSHLYFQVQVLFMKPEESIFVDNYQHRMRKQTREKRKCSTRSRG